MVVALNYMCYCTMCDQAKQSFIVASLTKHVKIPLFLCACLWQMVHFYMNPSIAVLTGTSNEHHRVCIEHVEACNRSLINQDLITLSTLRNHAWCDTVFWHTYKPWASRRCFKMHHARQPELMPLVLEQCSSCLMQIKWCPWACRTFAAGLMKSS